MRIYEHVYAISDFEDIVIIISYEYADIKWQGKLTSYNVRIYNLWQKCNASGYNGYIMNRSSGSEVASFSDME